MLRRVFAAATRVIAMLVLIAAAGFLSLLFGVIGTVLLALGVGAFFLVRTGWSSTDVPPYSDAPLGPVEFESVYNRSDTVLAWRRRAPRIRFRTLPSITLFVVLLLTVLYIVEPLVSGAFHYSPKGLLLAPLQSIYYTQNPKLMSAAVVIRIEWPPRHPEPSLVVNGEPVSRSALPERLRKELALRPASWPVYVQGDPNLPFYAVVDVLDMIAEQRAEAVLLTTR